MYALTMNCGDGDTLSTAFCGLFETHDDAHAAMVERIETHRNDWMQVYRCSADDLTVKVEQDKGYLIAGDEFDWQFYEHFFIFDTDDGKTFVY